MKLIRFGDPGKETPGLLRKDGVRIDASAFGSDYDEAFFGGEGLAELRRWADREEAHAPVVPDDIRLGPPVKRPGKLLCIGMNYHAHAKELGSGIPMEPLLFSKAVSALSGPFDPIVIPRGASRVDWEVEMAIVIGKKAKYVEEVDAFRHVAGYTIMNDVSERDFQKNRGGQWVKGKSADTFAPLGPAIVTRDEITDPGNLGLQLKRNGEVRQESNTSDLIFGVSVLVSHLSWFMSLLPGDVISTGTPAGVGLGCHPPQFLTPGDVLELTVEGLGTQRQEVRTDN